MNSGRYSPDRTSGANWVRFVSLSRLPSGLGRPQSTTGASPFLNAELPYRDARQRSRAGWSAGLVRGQAVAVWRTIVPMKCSTAPRWESWAAAPTVMAHTAGADAQPQNAETRVSARAGRSISTEGRIRRRKADGRSWRASRACRAHRTSARSFRVPSQGRFRLCKSHRQRATVNSTLEPATSGVKAILPLLRAPRHSQP